MRRRFNRGERRVLFRRAGGCCESCGVELEPGWHADHVHPYKSGGPTDVVNGSALCPPCNLMKGSKLMMTGLTLRGHQAEAVKVAVKRRLDQGHFQVTLDHCVGSGKTLTATAIDRELRAAGVVTRTIYYAPRTALHGSCLEAFARLSSGGTGDQLWNPTGNETPLIKRGYGGFVSTYQSLIQPGAADDHLMAVAGHRFHLIVDEAHFAGADATAAGAALGKLMAAAAFTTVMTGTIERTDRTALAGVEYDAAGMPVAHHVYGIAEGIRDGYLRQPEFRPQNLDVEHLSELGGTTTTPLEQVEDGLKRILPSEKVWGPMVGSFVSSHQWARSRDPRAKGIVFAPDQPTARRIHAALQMRGQVRPVLAISDDPASERELKEFRSGRSQADVLVCVEKVSVGYDCPQLQTALMLTAVRASVSLTQMVGRVLRVDAGSPIDMGRQSCRILHPNDPRMDEFMRNLDDASRLGLAMRDDDDEAGEPAARDRQPSGEVSGPFVVGASGFTERSRSWGGAELTAEQVARGQEWIDANGGPPDDLDMQEYFRHVYTGTLGTLRPAIPAGPVDPRQAERDANKELSAAVASLMHRTLGFRDQEMIPRLLTAACGRRRPKSCTSEEVARYALAVRNLADGAGPTTDEQRAVMRLLRDHPAYKGGKS